MNTNVKRDQSASVLADFARDANALAKEHVEYREAKAHKAQTEDELLGEILRLIHPALPAISSKIGDVRGIEIAPGVILLEGGGFWGTQRRGTILLREILDNVPLSAIVGVLLVAVRAQRGKLTPRTEQIKREASILEGVALAFRVGGVR